MGKLNERVAIVTGGASGIGHAIALKFASEGAIVAVVDINEKASQDVVMEIESQGGKAIAVGCDVTVEEQVNRAVHWTVAELGALHILVNNAGVSPLKPFSELELAEWNKVLAINLTGPFLFMKAAFPHIANAGPLGRIINMGSLAGQIGGIAVGLHYTASKGGIMAMTKQMAKLLAPYHATANNIAPATTDTPLVQAWPEETRQALIRQIPLGRLGQAEDVAGAAIYLASDEARFVTGATINVNGGMFIAGV